MSIRYTVTHLQKHLLDPINDKRTVITAVLRPVDDETNKSKFIALSGELNLTNLSDEMDVFEFGKEYVVTFEPVKEAK